MRKQEIHKAIQFATRQGFQKGKLEQKKEELKFLKERCIYCMIADERIKQLQEEIGGNSK